MATTKTAPPKAKATPTDAKPAKSKAEAAAPKTAPVKAVPQAAAPRPRVPAPEVKPAPVVVPTLSILPASSIPAASDQPVRTKPAPKTRSAETEATMLKKSELVDRVVEESGAKKKDVKLIVEAMLAVLGKALSNGEELNLPPLGKAKVNRQREDKSGEMIIIKLKRGGKAEGGGKGAKQALAEQDEDD